MNWSDKACKAGGDLIFGSRRPIRRALYFKSGVIIIQ